MRIEISWKTIIKVLSAILLAYVAVKLWPLCQILIVSTLLAVPLYRLAAWAWGKGWPRWAGLLLAILTLVFGVVGLAALVGPVVVSQASNLGKNLPKLEQQLVSRVPPGPLQRQLERTANLSSNEAFQRFSTQALAAVKTTAGAVLDGVLVIALAIYLIIDGPRALQWLIAYFPPGRRRRVSKGLQNIGDRVVAFIVGQSILSGLFAAYVMIVLSVLHVPMALLLAVLAGILDVVPVLGISISLVLGATIAMTVSTSTSLIVLGCYGAYHILENYVILPKVYGNKLRLSTLAVLLSMIGGGMVAGIVGAIATLPLVAAYPALEALWLAPQLEPEVVKDHQEQLRAA
ncbi:MAG TPA: AI-2E family transporter [Candidatus Acidoferrum sp.]|nr:AI-2E family transporter [Candidatus Acidoferrum sp.]